MAARVPSRFKADFSKPEPRTSCEGCTRPNTRKCPKARLADPLFAKFKLSGERECWSDDPREAR